MKVGSHWFVVVVVVVVAVGFVAVPPAQGLQPQLAAVIGEIQAVTSHCTADHRLTPEQLGQLRAPVTADEAAAFRPTANLQCFALCMLEEAGLIAHPGGLQADRLIEVSVLHGKAEADMQTRLERCRPLYRAGLSCADAWELYVCLTQ